MWLNEFGGWITYKLIQAYHQYGVGSLPLCKLKQWCTWLAAASDKVYQMLAHDRWLSPGPPASFTKTGRHDIAEKMLKVAIKHQISNIILLTALVPPYNPPGIIHKISNINIELFCRCVFLSSFNFQFYLLCKLRQHQKRKCLLESQSDFN